MSGGRRRGAQSGVSSVPGPTPRRGDIWYAYTQGQPDDPHQSRPVLVVSEDIRNRRADDVIVVAVFPEDALDRRACPLRLG